MTAGRPSHASNAAHRARRSMFVIACCFAPGLAFVCFGVRGAAAQAAPESLSVDDCIARARRLAPAVRAAREARVAAALDSSAAALNRRPALALRGDATLAPRDFYDPALTNLGQYDLGAAAEWTLLDGGGRLRNRLRGALGADGARADLALASREAAARAAAVALDLLRLADLGRVQLDALDWLDRLAVLVNAGASAGTRGRADAVRVAIERDAVLASLESLRELEDERRRELAALIGLEAGAGAALREPDAGLPPVPAAGDSAALLESADRAPEVRAAEVAAATERLALLDARGAGAMRVDLSADAGLAGTDLTRAVPDDFLASHPGATFSDRLRRDLGASVSIAVRLPVRDASRPRASGAREAALRAASIRAEDARARRRREALDLLARWRSAARRFEASRVAAGRASDHLLYSRSLYAGGALSLLELLDARRAGDDARERLVDARTECRAARYEAELTR
jgi:outer membrane protein TolC